MLSGAVDPVECQQLETKGMLVTAVFILSYRGNAFEVRKLGSDSGLKMRMNI